MIILVVDAISLVLRNLDRILSNYGYEVLTANSGERALEILKQDHRINLVITDLIMPEMNAVELFKASRAIERVSDAGISPPPEFLLLTSIRPDSDINNANARLLQDVVDLGFIDVLVKPVDREKLLLRVQQLDNSTPGASHFAPKPNGEKKTSAPTHISDQIQRLDAKHEKLEKRINALGKNQNVMQSDLKEIKDLLTDSAIPNSVPGEA